MNYRRDIDGLRAIAVLAVIANHLPVAYLPSGFLGVDVFFVISGFVITASLFNQEPSSLSALYTNFFSRRVKRLLPALFTFVLLTSGYILIRDPFPTESIKTGIASLFGLSNIVLYVEQLDYFAVSSKFNAYTHTWSLGVEEQFYLLFPLVLWLSFFTQNDRKSTKRLALLILALSLVSLTAFLYLYEENQSAAFFLTPMRIWEFGAGALAYIFSVSNYYQYVERLSGKISLIFLIILFCVFFAPEKYAAKSTVMAVFLTFGVLLSRNGTFVRRVLSIPVVVFIGQISYSLYLWHWPVITQKAFGLTRLSDSMLVYLFLMLAMAILSYYLVERPLRHKRWSLRKGNEIAIGAAIGIALALFITVGEKLSPEIEVKQGGYTYPANFLPALSNGESFNSTCVIAANKLFFRKTMYEDCTTLPSRPDIPMIWAMGDSHVGHLQGMLYEMHSKAGVGVHLTVTNGNAFPLAVEEKVEKEAREARDILFERASSDIKRGDIFVVTRLYYAPTFAGNPVNPSVYPWFNQVSELAMSLSKRGVNLVVFGPLPYFEMIEHIKDCSPVYREVCAKKREELIGKIQPIYEKIQQLSASYSNVYFFDPFPVFCPVGQKWCYPEEEHIFMFRDPGHLNSYGSRKLADSFEKFLLDNDLLSVSP